jgi:DNA processing protein
MRGVLGYGGTRRLNRLDSAARSTRTSPTIKLMADSLHERAALVALLRRDESAWSEISLDILESGSAVAVLDRTARDTDALFSLNADPTHLVTEAAQEIASWEADGIGVHAFFEPTYPGQLRGIREMPPILFTRGKLLTDSRAIAVVGTREASDEGLRIAQSVATALAHKDITVVSGLAKGIDTAAHRAALDAGGRTVAVIGTGIRRFYPTENRSLQEHIADVGLIISQFWPDAAPAKQTFPMRNAVMSGYAAATVVIEAGWKSGARIQARKALQHGRPVVLTDQLLQHEWARQFRENPGVHVVKGIVELMDVIETILGQAPSDAGLESFPDLAAL